MGKGLAAEKGPSWTALWARKNSPDGVFKALRRPDKTCTQAGSVSKIVYLVGTARSIVSLTASGLSVSIPRRRVRVGPSARILHLQQGNPGCPGC